MAFDVLIKYTAKVIAVLVNGHFAMVAIVKMCVQGCFTGPRGRLTLYTNSPRRAF